MTDNNDDFGVSRRTYLKSIGIAAAGAAVGTADAAIASGDVHSLGAGSYSTAIPESSGTNTNEPPNYSNGGVVTTDNWSGPVPSHDWWSCLQFTYNPFTDASDQISLGSPVPLPHYVDVQASGALLQNPGRWEGTLTDEDATVPVEEADLVRMDYRNSPGLHIGHSATSTFGDVRPDSAGDWNVTARWGAGTATTLDVTMTKGSPFTFVEVTGGDATLSALDQSNESLADGRVSVWAEQGNVLGLTIEAENGDSQHFGVFAPTGATWSGVGTSEMSSSLNGQDYFTVATLPEASGTVLSEFESYAYNVVTDTTVDWTYSDGSESTVETTYSITTTNRPESSTAADETLFCLLPHQYKHSSDATMASTYDYWSPRGTLHTRKGSGFTTTMTYAGTLPNLPDVGAQDNAELSSYLSRLENDFGPYVHPESGIPGEPYWVGKDLYRNASVLPLAEFAGYSTDYFLNATQRRLEQFLEVDTTTWSVAGTSYDSSFTLADGSASDYGELFYYDDEIGTAIGYPGGEFGAVQALNDHHLQFAYVVYAAAEVARYNPGWAGDSQYGQMVDMIVRDYANWERPDPNGTMDPSTDMGDSFPFLRCFDIYDGHSWAGGIHGNDLGNNQESASEAVFSYAAMIRWAEERIGATTEGTEAHQQAVAMRDAAVFLYTHETAAMWEYWFDEDADSIPEDWGADIGNEMNADRPDLSVAGTDFQYSPQLWGSGYWRHVYWYLGDPIELYGINWLPIGGHSFFLGKNQQYAQQNWDKLLEARSFPTYNVSHPGRNWPSGWEVPALGYRAMHAPEDANTIVQGELPIEPSGSSSAFLYHWAATMNEIGVPDQTVTADATQYQVFADGEQRTYVAYNPDPDSSMTVTFSDGTTLSVPGGEIAYTRSAANYTPESSAPDTPSPSVTSTTSYEATVDWPAVTDNGDAGLQYYNVYVDGEKFRQTTETSATVSGISDSVPAADMSATFRYQGTSESADAAVDGDAGTAHQITSSLASSQFRVTVDMGGSQTFDDLVLDQNGSDWPATVDIEVYDGSWTTVGSFDNAEQATLAVGSQTASKVRIVDTDDTKTNWWSIAEITARSGGTALDKSAWTATADSLTERSADAAVDGNTGTSFSSELAVSQEAMEVEIDLGGARTIDRVAVTHAGTDFPSTMDVEVYDGGWTTVESTVRPVQGTTEVVFTQRSASKVRLVDTDDTSGSWWQIQDVSVSAYSKDFTLGVSAVDTVGNESSVGTVNVALDDTDTHPPAAPDAWVLGAGKDHITVVWAETADRGAGTGVSEYRVYLDGASSPAVTNTDPGDLTATIEGLAADSTHGIEVTAVDANGNESAATSLEATTLAASAPDQTPYGGTPHEIPGRIEAERYDEGPGGDAWVDTSESQGLPFRGDAVDIEADDQGDYHVSNAVYGEFLEYTVDIAEAGSYDMIVRAARGQADASGPFYFEIDDDKVTDQIQVPGTGSWTSYARTTFEGIDLPAGEHTLRLYNAGGGFNLDSIEFWPSSGGDVTLPSAPGNLAAPSVTETTVDLSWDASTDDTGVDHYNLYEDGWKTTELSGTSTTVSGLEAGRAYTFAVTAVDAAGNESPKAAVSTRTAGQSTYGDTPQIPARIEAEHFDYGGQDRAYNDTTAGKEQYTAAFRPSSDVDVQAHPGGYHLGYFAAGEWVEYTVNVPSSGTYDIKARVSTTSTSGPTLSVDVDGSAVGSTTVASTGDWQNYETVTVVADASLSAGEHTIRVTTGTGNVNLDWIEVGSPADTTPPAAPSGLSADATTDTTVDLSWTPSMSGDVAEHRLSVDGTQTQTLAADASATTVTGLSPNTTYDVAVTAVDDADNESTATTATATTTIEVDYTQSAGKVDASTADITFSPDQSVTGVDLTYSVAGGSQTTTAMAESSGTYTAQVSGLADGDDVTYSFTYSRAGTSRQTTSYSYAHTGDTTAPSAPSNLAATATTDSSVDLSWDPASDAGSGVSYYRVYDASGLVKDSVSGTSTTVSGLASATTYDFTVTAVDGAGNASGDSNVATATTDSGSSGTSVEAAINCGDSSSHTTGAGVTYSADDYFSGGAADSADRAIAGTDEDDLYDSNRWGNDATYDVPVSDSGATYDVTLHFAETYWSSAGSRVYDVLVEGTTALAEFDPYAAAGGTNTAVSRTVTGVTPTDGAVTISFNGITDNALLSGIEIVQAGGDAGDTTAPTAPSNLVSTGKTGTSVDLSWDASTDDTGVDHYNVSVDGTKDQEVAASTTTATVSGLADDTTYDFEVSAVDAAGNESAAAGPLSVATTDETAPAAPTNLASTGTASTTVDLSWDASTSSDVATYAVYEGGTSAKTGVSGTATTVSGLSANTTYDFTVRAVDDAGNESGDSNTATVTTDGQTPSKLDESNWTATALLDNVSDAAEAIDGDGTRWTSETAISAGEARLLVDFGGSQTLDSVTIEHYGSDYPATLDVELYDGTSWTTVASPSLSSATTTMSFASQSATKLRLVETDSSTSSWWSVLDVTASDAGTALDRANWTATGFVRQTQDAAEALDGESDTTAWSSGIALADREMALSVDLGGTSTLTALDVTHSGSDYPATLDVEVYDGSWTTVASGVSVSSGTTTIDIADQSGSTVRLVETDGSKTNWWAITDVSLQGY